MAVNRGRCGSPRKLYAALFGAPRQQVVFFSAAGTELRAVGEPGGVPTIALSGSPGRSYITEASANLQDWQPFATNTLVSGFTNVLDPGGLGEPTRFYRARTGR